MSEHEYFLPGISHKYLPKENLSLNRYSKSPSPTNQPKVLPKINHSSKQSSINQCEMLLIKQNQQPLIINQKRIGSLFSDLEMDEYYLKRLKEINLKSGKKKKLPIQIKLLKKFRYKLQKQLISSFQPANSSSSELSISCSTSRQNSNSLFNSNKQYEQQQRLLNMLKKQNSSCEQKNSIFSLSNREDSFSDDTDEEYEIWDESEIYMRGIDWASLNKQHRTQQFLLLYKMRYGMFPNQRENISNEQVVQNMMSMTNGNFRSHLKYFGNPQKAKFTDQNDYSQPVNLQSDQNFMKFKDFAQVKKKIQYHKSARNSINLKGNKQNYFYLKSRNLEIEETDFSSQKISLMEENPYFN